MRTVNVLECEPTHSHERGTIASRGTRLGPQIGATKIGAGLYELEADRWMWPYHYHHGVEEWLFVISGTPVLREPHGQRALESGDLVCFPSGFAGAHAVAGPGRVVMFSVGGVQTSICVYPDSDKVGTRPRDVTVPGLDDLDFRRQDAVDYWYGEGSDEPVDAPELVRPPADAPARPVVNVLTLEAPALDEGAPDGFRRRNLRLGPLLGGERFGATLCELDAGQGSAPYHLHYGHEECVLVISGTPALRHPGGEQLLAPGDLVSFPEGPDGAHRLLNRTGAGVRVVFFSTQELPTITEYPDSAKVRVRYPGARDTRTFRFEDEVGYWDGEA